MHWPPEQRFIDDAGLAALAERCRPAFLADCAAMRTDNYLSPMLETLYLPLAAWLRAGRAAGGGDGTRIVGVCGAQGSGKSTFCRLLGTVLSEAFDETPVTLSIDDIYETHERREELAAEVHPLFATRGVPGTHDVALGIDTIERLATLGAGETAALPVFDKAMDTRLAPQRWRTHRGPVSTLLFEGWCVGAVPESEAALRGS